MSGTSKIEWTDATWNPVVGCSLVSPGCTNCYAMKVAGARLDGNPKTPHYAGTTQKSKAGPVWSGKVAVAPERTLLAPLKWEKSRMVFVNSMGDLFHESIADEVIDRIFAVMALCPQHTFQVLTKRAERMRTYLMDAQCRVARAVMSAAPIGRDIRYLDIRIVPGASMGAWPLPNVWLGVSAEDQQRADKRIPHLLETPAAVLFVSAEPLLGSIDFRSIRWGHATALARLDWIIAGGESGPGARPMHPDWPRFIRDQCKATGVPYFFKQWGAWLPWEPEHGPCWKAQNGQSEDHHVLFPADFDSDPNWDDGLWGIHDGCTHFAFQRVGKRAAGRLLDGREHNDMPMKAGPAIAGVMEGAQSDDLNSRQCLPA